MFKDLINSLDAGLISLRDKAKQMVDHRYWSSEHTVIEYKGWVRCLMRERGKIVSGSLREGHNIWTTTGREFDALKKTIQTPPTTTYRNDAVGYIGVGTGTQVEDVNVTSLVTPVQYAIGVYLATLDLADFPLTPTRTTVRYKRLYLANEITIAPGSSVNITELGLFTNGSPIASPAYNAGTRDPSVGTDPPVAYKTFEPFTKKDTLEFEVLWEIRH